MKSIYSSLGYLINTSARLIKRTLDQQLKAYNLTTSQWAVLKLLSKENGLSQAEITDRLNSDRATCGAVIEKLIQKELVQKELSSTDRRSYIVRTTQTANTIIDEVTAIAERTNAEALKSISDDDISRFVSCLECIITNLGGELRELED